MLLRRHAENPGEERGLGCSEQVVSPADRAPSLSHRAGESFSIFQRAYLILENGQG